MNIPFGKIITVCSTCILGPGFSIFRLLNILYFSQYPAFTWHGADFPNLEGPVPVPKIIKRNTVRHKTIFSSTARSTKHGRTRSHFRHTFLKFSRSP